MHARGGFAEMAFAARLFYSVSLRVPEKGVDLALERSGGGYCERRLHKDGFSTALVSPPLSLMSFN